MLAIIKTGGKQYQVKVGDKVKIEKIEGEVGSTVVFPEVLFMGDETDVKVGAPFLAGAVVEGKILRTEQGDKVTGVKFKAKKRYHVKFGHRQIFTEVEITKIA
ncbi:MAG: 50S ribosomal protein L21 [Candidatus Moraniibacteriota bacterium]